jgi:hypothetical protein
MVGPRTGIREGVEGRIQCDQPGDLVPGLGVEFLKGDLANDLVAEVAPCPGGRTASSKERQNERQTGKRTISSCAEAAVIVPDFLAT